MKQIKSYIEGRWFSPQTQEAVILSPVDGTEFGYCGTDEIEMANVVAYARDVGAKNLRETTFYERAMRLKSLATYLQSHRQMLYPQSYYTGATHKDSMIDIDGGISTLFVYASKGRRQLPDNHVIAEGAMERLSREGNFVGQHIQVPRNGVAIQINAFNFPVWGMLEKFAPTFLAGMPMIVKPATVTCYLTEMCVRLMLKSELLPAGCLQLICGNTKDLLTHTISQDVISFTGSAETANKIKSDPHLLENNIRFIAEQDSLNASVLGLDAKPESDEFQQMLREAVREITAKSGQKCTAMRRIFVPEKSINAFMEQLKQKLKTIKIGAPSNKDVQMGCLVSQAQLKNVNDVINQLLGEAERFLGDEPLELHGDEDMSKGAFMSPNLLYHPDPDNGDLVHKLEAFGPVATIMPYRDTAHAAKLANKGGGSLVTSLFTKSPDIAREFTYIAASYHGRIYFANGITGKQATGHGSPMPHMVHGGPGRAGGGEELGGLRGMNHYLQRTAIQGNPDIVSAVSGKWMPGGTQITEGAHPFRLYLEELTIGKTFLSGERKITRQDIGKFAEFTGDKFYAHLDEEMAKTNPFFEGRVAHGYLLVSFAAGLFVDPDPGPVLANYGLDNLRFTQPVYPGETIRVELSVMTIDGRNPEYGEVRWYVAIINNKDEQVASYELLTMNSKKEEPKPSKCL